MALPRCPSSVVNPSAVAGSERRSTARQIQSKRTEFVCPSATLSLLLGTTLDGQTDSFKKNRMSSSNCDGIYSHTTTTAKNNNSSNNKKIMEINTSKTNVVDDQDLVDDFWKMAHVATCLHQSTLASSCTAVHEAVTTATTTTANQRMGEEEAPPAAPPAAAAGAVDVNAVCHILGNDMDICAYIRLDGSIANNNNNSSNENNNNINTNILNRQNQCCYYTTAAVECNGNIRTATPSLSNNDSSDGESRQYYYYNREKGSSAELLSMLSEMNQQQLEQLSQLSGMYLTDKLLLRGKGRAGRRGQRMVDATSTNISTEASTASPYSSTTALASNAAVAIFQTLKSGATRVMNGVLSVIEGAEANDAYFDAIASDSGNSGSAATLVDESSSLQIRKLLTKDVASEAIVAASSLSSSGENASFDNGDNVDDTAALLGRTRRTKRHGETLNNTNLSSVLPPINSEDMLISIPVVAYTCRHLLTFAQSVVSSRCGVGKDVSIDVGRVCDYTAFFVSITQDGDGASAARIIMYIEGWDTCSFGMFCRKAGGYLASLANCTDDTATTSTPTPFSTPSMTEPQTIAQYGKLLSNMTREEVDLLATTLCKSNFAIVEKDLLILFPGGVPADIHCHNSSLVEAAATTTPPTLLSSSDSALFQIHVTKISIQNKMARLEREANVAKNNAIQARRDNKDTTNELALVYMRRRKAALDELERCSSMLSNLDACELRLERAREDVQLVQSYTYFRTAMQDVRKSRDEVLRIGSSTSNSYEDVEELMLDIREEMDEMNEMNSQMNKMMTIDQYNEIDEEELNEEFRRLELECESANQEQSFPKVIVEDDSALVKKAQLDPPLMTTTGLQKEESSSPETLIEPAY
jgi:hypothetical protein